MLDALLRRFPWFDHPEGMKFAEVHRNAERSIGHWLFLPGNLSAFHRVLNGDEIWSIHAGRIDLHVLEAPHRCTRWRLGLDLASGEVPLATVPRGAWQAAELPAGTPFAFGSNVCAPPFQYAEMQLGSAETLAATFPEHADLVRRLTRTGGQRSGPDALPFAMNATTSPYRFPDAISRLPAADIPLPGLTAHLSQGADHQVLFMSFAEDAEVPEHAHEAQWGVVLSGVIELTIGGQRHVFRRGDSYQIPAGVKHSARIFSGYADITFFDAPARYRVRGGEGHA